MRRFPWKGGPSVAEVKIVFDTVTRITSVELEGKALADVQQVAIDGPTCTFSTPGHSYINSRHEQTDLQTRGSLKVGFDEVVEPQDQATASAGGDGALGEALLNFFNRGGE
jgi:hypothetical protein